MCPPGGPLRAVHENDRFFKPASASEYAPHRPNIRLEILVAKNNVQEICTEISKLNHSHEPWVRSNVLGLFLNNVGSWPVLVKWVSHSMLPLHSRGNAICRTLPGALLYPSSRPVAGTPRPSIIATLERRVLRPPRGAPPPVPAGRVWAAVHGVGRAGSGD